MSLILLCVLLISFSTHIKGDKPHANLVLGLSHVRSLSTPPTPLTTPKLLDFLDIIEPLTTYRDGYLLPLTLGTPPQVLQVYMDTGSDLTWVPCGDTGFECMACGNAVPTTAFFSLSQSSSSAGDLCASSLCADVHSSDNAYDPCAAAGCSVPDFLSGLCSRPCPPFSYTYGGGGLVLGSLARDTVRVHASIDSTSSVPIEFFGFCFGCVGSSLREPIGIAGFGKGALSMPSQLGFLDKGFSHCFVGFRFLRNPNVTSPLVAGNLTLSSTDGFLFTPMLKSVIYPNYYYIGLENVGVGDGTVVAAPPSLAGFDDEGNGGVVVDTGTTYTHLPDPFYSALLASLGSMVGYERSYEMEARTGFGLCYKVPCDGHGACTDELPAVSFQFVGGAKLALPRESCYYAVTAPKNSVVVKCLLFQRMDDDNSGRSGGGGGVSGPGAVFGSFQMQNVEVVYDLEVGRIGFKPRDCALSSH